MSEHGVPNMCLDFCSMVWVLRVPRAGSAQCYASGKRLSLAALKTTGHQMMLQHVLCVIAFRSYILDSSHNRLLSHQSHDESLDFKSLLSSHNMEGTQTSSKLYHLEGQGLPGAGRPRALAVMTTPGTESANAQLFCWLLNSV